ncbi:hypothetical protein KUW14_01480 [Pseudooceanicola nitratireducens]|uniref:DUF6478 family protein n=1 Tax=Pseudooceanicola nitratireducens TaxID=517719 RepID=UPI001C988AE7|nr:DUF6478 family protein [Pseudooceanicola nitratireducens]MBY6164504.1 hypothetical protein [Pseudooceanicola nitratireducens]
MVNALKLLLDRWRTQAELRRWKTTARAARTMPLSDLRATRARARSLRQPLDDLLHAAESRLALPVIGSNVFPLPHGTDWSWRPELWRGPIAEHGIASAPSKSRLGHEITLHHDCIRSELSLRQIRNTRAEDLAPFGLRMDVFAFDGSFLSLVVELPPEALQGLKASHLIRLTMRVELEKPLEIFARLNIKHGPNTEQIVREFPISASAPGHTPAEENMIEFDLAYADLNEDRLENAWLDLIFEGPEMNQVTLRDLTLARCPRAEF